MERNLNVAAWGSWLLVVACWVFAAPAIDAQILGPPVADQQRWLDSAQTVEIVEEAEGWYRLRIWESTPTDDTGGGTVGNEKTAQQPPYVDRLVVYRMGVDSAPLPQWAKDQLMAEAFPAPEPTGWEVAKPNPMDSVVVDEVAMWAVHNGHAPHTVAKSDSKTWTKTFDRTETESFQLGNGFDGSLTATLPIHGSVTLEVRSDKVFWWLKPNYFKLTGDVTVTGDIDLSGELTGLSLPELSYELFDFDIYRVLGLVRLRLRGRVGLSAEAEITGEIGVTTDVDISGTFRYECARNNGRWNCDDETDFTDDFNSTYTLGLELDARAELSASAELKADIVEGYIQAAVTAKGFVAADLWGYYGNTCGDADGDGNNELVRALTAGVEAGYDIDAYYEFGGRKTPFDLYDYTFQLGWWDLLGAGGSTALTPMIVGPESVHAGAPVTYEVRMRPCYPWDEDVGFTIYPDMSGGRTISNPPNGTTTLSHTFQTVGNENVAVTVQGDSQGRTFQGTTARTVTVTEAPDPPIIVSQPVSSTVVEGGTAQFSASVVGSAPFTYQWRRNGANLSNGGRLSGVDTPQLTISDVGAADAAMYSVRISNGGGQVTSDNAFLSVTGGGGGGGGGGGAACSLQTFAVTNYPQGLPRVEWTTDCASAGDVSVRVRTSTVGSVPSGCELSAALWDGGKNGNRTVDYMAGGYNGGCPAVTAADFWVQLWDTASNTEISRSATQRATYDPPPLPCDISSWSVTNRGPGELPMVSWNTTCEGTNVSVQVKTSTTSSVPAGCEVSRALWDGHKNGNREAQYMAGGYGNNCPAVTGATFWVELWDGEDLIRRTSYEGAQYQP